MVSTVAPERPLLTVRATAQALGVSEKTVRRLVHSGQLPALRVGGQLRLDQDELRKWLYEFPASRAADRSSPAVEPRAHGAGDRKKKA
jgi:excisionase family DNA binding protein